MKVKFLSQKELINFGSLILLSIVLLVWGKYLEGEVDYFIWQKQVGFGVLTAAIILFVSHIANYFLLIQKQKIKIVKYNYEESIAAVRAYIKQLVEEEEAVDAITLYIADEDLKDEYNLIAYAGLRDPTPMFGPVVYDDFRKTLNGKADEHWELSIPPIEDTNENKENSGGFREREGVKSRVTFILRDDKKDPLVALFFNWRSSKEHYHESKKTQKREYANVIFEAIKKSPAPGRNSISTVKIIFSLCEQIKREKLNLNGGIIANNEIITTYIYRYFDELKIISRGALRIMLIKKENEKYKLISGKNYGEKSLPSIKEQNKLKLHLDWVLNTTRSKFIIDKENPGGLIIIPIRKRQGKQEESFGLISIECQDPGKLEEYMVKNLYLLADEFGSRFDINTNL